MPPYHPGRQGRGLSRTFRFPALILKTIDQSGRFPYFLHSGLPDLRLVHQIHDDIWTEEGAVAKDFPEPGRMRFAVEITDRAHHHGMQQVLDPNQVRPEPVDINQRQDHGMRFSMPGVDIPSGGRNNSVHREFSDVVIRQLPAGAHELGHALRMCGPQRRRGLPERCERVDDGVSRHTPGFESLTVFDCDPGRDFVVSQLQRLLK